MSSTRHLNRERIAAAALAIADAEGFGSVSMRRVAQELCVGTMSLYDYVRTKAELIAAMDDALMAEVVAPSLPRDWRKALTMIALHTGDVFMRHPWALASMQSAPPGVNAMRYMEQCLRVLSGTGMSAQENLTLLAVTDHFVFGYALRETAGDPNVDVDLARKPLATGALLWLAGSFCEERVCAMPNRFRLGLQALFAFVAKRTIAPPARPPERIAKKNSMPWVPLMEEITSISRPKHLMAEHPRSERREPHLKCRGVELCATDIKALNQAVFEPKHMTDHLVD